MQTVVQGSSENRWHSRRATHRHFQWFKNLSRIHEITASWIEQLKATPAPYSIFGADHASAEARLSALGLPASVTENLWMLSSFAKAELDNLMDDTYPDDVLGRLERTVWSLQAFVVIRLLESSTEPHRKVLDSILEQTAWKLGRRAAEADWGEMRGSSRGDLQQLVRTLSSTPFGGLPGDNAVLVKRSVPREVRIELRTCAHHSASPEVRSVADDLCRIHSHWLRGFAYGLNPSLVIETQCRDGRCDQRWHFAYSGRG